MNNQPEKTPLEPLPTPAEPGAVPLSDAGGEIPNGNTTASVEAKDAAIEAASVPADTTHWRHSVLVLLLAIVFVAASAELAYAVVNVSAMPVYIKDAAGLPVRWVGIIGTAFLLTEGVLKGPMGALGDRIGRKPLIILGPVVSTFTAVLTPRIHNPYSLAGLRVLDGIGAAALWPAVFSLIGDHVPQEKRATAMSAFNVAYILGIAFGPAVGGNINHWTYQALHHTMRHTRMRDEVAFAVSKESSFYVAAVLFALTAIAALIFVPRFRPTAPGGSGHGGEEGFHAEDFKRMLARIPMTLLMTFTTFLGIGFIMLYIKTFALEQNGPFHMNEQSFGNTLVIPALLIGALSIPMGTLGDKIGKARAVHIGIGLCMTAYWLLLLMPSRSTMVVLGTLIGVGFVLAFPAWMALVTEQSGDSQRGAAVGAVATAQGLGAITGSSLSAWLYPKGEIAIGPIHLPAHGLPFLCCGVMLTVSFLLALTTVHAPHPGQSESESLG